MFKKLLTFILLQCATSITFAANYLTFTAGEDGSLFGIEENKWRADVQYSTDGGETWNQLNPGEMVTLEHKGDKAILRGENSTGFSYRDSKYLYFVMEGSIAASGSVMSLIDGVGESLTIPNDYCFYNLFRYCTSLTEAPELPATELTAACYAGMFYECTSLVKAPKLPAKTIVASCYQGMFNGCTSLTEAPDLPATGLTYWDGSCYERMFQECTSLTKAPALPSLTLSWNCYSAMFLGCTSLKEAPALPATTMEDFCYSGMFAECTSLTEAPELPATILAEKCYGSMFRECTSLTKAPTLPADSLVGDCYAYMFKGCVGLTKAPVLSATSLPIRCYQKMFQECKNLSEVNVSFTKWEYEYNANETTDWLLDVAPTGTFICPKALPEEYGANRIPEGWTIKYLDEDNAVEDINGVDNRVWTEGLTICVRENAGDTEVYDLGGKLVKKVRRGSTDPIRIACPGHGVYIVKVGNKSIRVEL